MKGEAQNWYIKDTLLPLIGSLTIIVFAKFFIFKITFSRWVELLLIIVVGLLSLLATIPFSNKLRNNLVESLRERKFKI